MSAKQLSNKEKEYILKFGKKVILLREKQDITQKELAEKIGTSRMHMYRIESGQVEVGLVFVKRIADVLGVQVYELAAED